MFEKRLKIGFIIAFFAMILIPLCTTNLEEGKISKAENRALAKFPSLYNEDGTLANFPLGFETWINDNIGFRSELVVQNAQIQYHVFDVLSNNSDMLLGPNGELNYATYPIIKSYQQLDLKSEDALNKIAEGYQYAYEYLKAKGIQLYYFQCWDKQSIYPEYFPKTIIQYGDKSKTDQVIETLEERTDIDVISTKQPLIDAKSQYQTYSKWGDPTHWTQRGSFISYQLLMNRINENNNGKYKVLQESDYNITMSDQGNVLFGGIHQEDVLENFELKNPQAYLSDEEPKWLSQWANKSRKVYYNDNVDNDDTLLILGDSYIDGYLYDDLAESFHKVVQVWGDYSPNFAEMIEYYHPSIVIVENAERCDRFDGFAQALLELKAAKAQ